MRQKDVGFESKILQDVAPIAQSGAISKVQYLKQQQEVESNQSDVDQLVQEQARFWQQSPKLKAKFKIHWQLIAKT